MNKILDEYSNFLKEYNLIIKNKNTDEVTYAKNLKLISNINKINTSNKITPSSNKTELKNPYYYKDIQSKVKRSLKYTYNKITETDKYDSAILKDSDAFFCILCALAYHHIMIGKPYLDLTKYL